MSAHPDSPWTAEKRDQLRALWAEGVSAAEIARRLGVTKNAIVGKVHRLGLSGRPSPVVRKVDGHADRMEASRRRREAHERGAGATLPVLGPKLPPEPVAVVRKALARYPCCWPVDLPNGRFGSCDEPSVPGKPYCAEHCALAFVPRSQVRRGPRAGGLTSGRLRVLQGGSDFRDAEDLP